MEFFSSFAFIIIPVFSFIVVYIVSFVVMLSFLLGH